MRIGMPLGSSLSRQRNKFWAVSNRETVPGESTIFSTRIPLALILSKKIKKNPVDIGTYWKECEFTGKHSVSKHSVTGSDSKRQRMLLKAYLYRWLQRQRKSS